MIRPRVNCPECGYSIRLQASGRIGYHSFTLRGVELVCLGSLTRPL